MTSRPTFTAQENIIQVWWAVLDVSRDTLTACRTLLSKEESEKASRFFAEKDAAHYIAARGFLRSLLARYIEVAPEQIIFDYGMYGKPSLSERNSPKGLNFNLSHSGGIALCAVTHNRNIGVDVEKKREIRDWENIAKSCLTQEEYESILSRPQNERIIGFLKIWTQKEAYIKGLGNGLSYPLQKFCLPYKSGEATVIAYDHHDPQQQGRWEFHDIYPSKDHIATIAVEGPDTRVQLNSWEW